MNNNTAIKVENVSKKYCKTLTHIMKYGTVDIAKDFFCIPVDSRHLRNGEFWAVNNVSFEVKRGETVGIMGSNGSGKSTVLKMLNGIFMPDRGRIEINGKMGALIEVGAGFHPMLTGRENVYVNGTILGLTKREIDKKIDEILEFADIGDFIDIPVKNYSSGMHVRLGFAIAINVNVDILLIDEVLAVGDMAFAYKAKKKIGEFMANGGTTIFVSHHIQAVRDICTKVLWLDHGVNNGYGDTHKMTAAYEDKINLSYNQDLSSNDRNNLDPAVQIKHVDLLDKDGRKCDIFKIGDYFKMRIHYECSRVVKNPLFAILIRDLQDMTIIRSHSHHEGCIMPSISGIGYIDFSIKKLPLKPSKYYCTAAITEDNIINLLDEHLNKNNYSFVVSSEGSIQCAGLIHPFPIWEKKV